MESVRKIDNHNKVGLYKDWKRLNAGTVPANKEYAAGTVPANKK